mmetsp:Transcript_19650/g.46901  ORF Transcript_19650/g.46901 Transcript_19650/m.46901 type:complete len:423 (-) Transcript_19650:2802-4070(-)
MNSFLILRIASCSPCLSLRPSMLSTSSTKTTLGAILCASVNSARTYFSPSPNHLLARLAIETLMKLAPLSDATALASIVFPVPGGPKRRTPRVGFVSEPRRNSSGRCSGSITTSCSVALTESRAPMSSNLTPTSAAGMTSDRSRFSNSLSVCTSLSELFGLDSSGDCAEDASASVSLRSDRPAWTEAASRATACFSPPCSFAGASASAAPSATCSVSKPPPPDPSGASVGASQSAGSAREASASAAAAAASSPEGAAPSAGSELPAAPLPRPRRCASPPSGAAMALCRCAHTAHPSTFSAVSGVSCSSPQSIFRSCSSGISSLNLAATLARSCRLALSRRVALSLSIAFFHSAAAGSSCGPWSMILLGSSRWRNLVTELCSARSGRAARSPSADLRGSKKFTSKSAGPEDEAPPPRRANTAL